MSQKVEGPLTPKGEPQFMRSLNLKVLRFSNDKVCKHSETAMKKLKI